MPRVRPLPLIFCLSVGLSAPAFSDDNTNAAPAPLSIQELFQKGARAEKNGEDSVALQYYIQAVTQDPANPRAQTALNRLSQRVARETARERSDRRERAVLDAERSLERTALADADRRDKLDLAWKRIGENKMFHAVDLFERILETSPQEEEATRGLAKIGQWAEARLKTNKFPLETHRAAAQGLKAYIDQEWSAAAAAFQIVLSTEPLPPEFSDGHLARVEALARRRANDAQFKKDRETFLSMAAVHQKEGRLKESRELLQQLLQRNPGDIEVRAKADALENMLSAVEENARAESRQKEVEDLLRRAGTLMVQNRFGEAREPLERALRLDPRNPEALERLRDLRRESQDRRLPADSAWEAQEKYRLGLKLYGDERYEEARNAFQAALALNPKDSDAKIALEHLEEDLKQKKPSPY